jgi:tetratricopeptide (TPR) repeat protein
MTTPQRADRIWPLLIFVGTLAVYLPALRDAGFIWDDDMYVTSNAVLRAPGGLWRIWFDPMSLPQYYPLVHTTFWLETRLWGLAPWGFHVVNVLLHAGAAVLAGSVLRRLAVPGAWLAAALFAVHPVQVESVAWITERKNVLSALLYFAAGLFLLRWVGALGRRRDLAAGTLLFVGALLSKTVTASLPAALLLVLWWKGPRIERRRLAVILSLLALGAALGLTTAWIERHHVGAVGEAWNLSPLERLLIAGRAVWFYAAKLVWPFNLSFIYPRWEIDPAWLAGYAFPLAAAAVVAALAVLRDRIGKGPLTAVLYFGGTLVPALGFFNVFPMKYSFVADHFQYLASIGLLGLMAAGAARLPRRVRGWGPAVVLTGLAVLTFRQCDAYRDLESLWRDTLAKNPGAWIAHTNLGLLLVRRGEVETGIAHYRESIRLEPGLVEPRLNLGEVLQRQGRADEAIDLLGALVREQPTHPMARYNLGTALARRGRYADARPHLEAALRLRPDLAEAAYNLGTLHLREGRLAEAEAAYRATLRVRPDHALAHNNLAAVLERLGRTEEARSHRIESARLRAWSLATHDDPESRNGPEAVRQGELACRDTAWGDPRSLDALAAAYAETGRFDDAIRTAERALTAARAAGDALLARAVAARLAGYRDRRPYRDPGSIPRPGEAPQR